MMNRWRRHLQCANCRYRTYDLKATVCPDCGGKVGKPPKYHNIKVKRDGYTFDSEWEYEVYQKYSAMQSAGEIANLIVHPPYTFKHHGVLIGRLTLDLGFVWLTGPNAGRVGVVDAKSAPTKTEAYGLRKRMLLAFYGLTIIEEVKPKGGKRHV